MPYTTASIALAGVLLGAVAGSRAGQADETGVIIATVRIGYPVLANRQPLPNGTYQIRLTDQRPALHPGQSAESALWVELVRNDDVIAREVATVIGEEEIGVIAKCAPPRPGEARVEMLRGGDILRVWVNHRGTHYLLHFPINRAATT
jgi:hypothetical protein